MQFNVAQQELVFRVAYAGPAMAGKRTNLREVHRLLDPRSCGRIRELNLAQNRAPSFELTPLAVRCTITKTIYHRAAGARALTRAGAALRY